MRVVFLSGCNTQQRKILHTIALNPKVELSLVRLLPARPSPPSKSKFARLIRNPLKLIVGRIESWNYARRERARQEFMTKYFGEQSTAKVSEITISRDDINSPAAVAQLQALRPEVLVVCGAPILKDAVISVASKVALNIHFGSAPRYRGEYCIFWSLLRSDFEHVEVTIHELTSTLDHGAVYLKGRPRLSTCMHEFEIEARLVEFVCNHINDLLNKLGDSSAVPTDPPSGVSELFRLRDRSCISDLRYYLLRPGSSELAPKKN